MSFDLLHIIILLGGVQALSLCFYLIYRKTENKPARLYFLLFLFCLSIYNLGYVAIFMNLQIGSFHFGALPIPYKYLIAPALFAYITTSLQTYNASIKRTIWLLMLPALLYGIVRMYWLYMILSGENPFIMKEAYDAGFFTVNEISYLLFNLILGIVMLRKRADYFSKASISFGTGKSWAWLKTFPKVFVGLSAIHLLLVIASLLIIGQHDLLFYYPTLIINSLFVYWIGFVGYSQPGLLFFNPLIKPVSPPPDNPKIHDALKKALEMDKVFKNPKLTSQQLASQLGLTMSDLTKYINEQMGCNFSQYLNKHRTEEAIRLMETGLSSKYTLEALAIEAGFNSKSSFYKVFKEQTGQTPAAFIKALN